jgi:hypothetical protein
VVSAHRVGPSALASEDAPAPVARGARPVQVAVAAHPEPVAAPALPEPEEPDLEIEPEAPVPPRRLVPLSDEASRVVLARGITREGMRADPSPRLARSRELTLAVHLEMDGPPLHVQVHVEPGEGDAGPWLRFKDLAPDMAERLDRLLTGLWTLSAGDGPEHALVVCEILEAPRG